MRDCDDDDAYTLHLWMRMVLFVCVCVCVWLAGWMLYLKCYSGLWCDLCNSTIILHIEINKYFETTDGLIFTTFSCAGYTYHISMWIYFIFYLYWIFISIKTTTTKTIPASVFRLRDFHGATPIYDNFILQSMSFVLLVVRLIHKIHPTLTVATSKIHLLKVNLLHTKSDL